MRELIKILSKFECVVSFLVERVENDLLFLDFQLDLVHQIRFFLSSSLFHVQQTLLFLLDLGEEGDHLCCLLLQLGFQLSLHGEGRVLFRAIALSGHLH